MAAIINKTTRRELVKALAQRYATVDKAAKGRILDEFAALSGYHRKHAIRVLGRSEVSPSRSHGTNSRSRIYDEAVRETLLVLWEASDRICGKRLKPLLPLLVSALERHGHLELDPGVREKLLSVSASTIDRLLGPARKDGSSRRRRSSPAVRRHIAVRTFADWKDPVPGFMEVDLVSHGGESVAGSFAHTMTLTDVASGWTECVALAVRDSGLVADAVEKMATILPFRLLGIDTDNGSEFINETLAASCIRNGIEFTRSRPYRKNDQAWVEQKNGSVVRRLVGYGRLEGIAATQSLSRLYASSRLFVNFFQPSFKLLDKTRVGARVRKHYQSPETPCTRLLTSEHIDDATKQRLRAVMVSLDPLALLDEIRAVQHHIAGLGRGEHIHVPAHRDADLDRFLRSLATTWRDGNPRPTHQQKAKPPRHWRTRKDPFAEVWPTILVWLEQEPDRTAKELFERLCTRQPAFHAGHLRTLQRRVKEWRRTAARRLVFSGTRDSVPRPNAPV